MASPHHKSRIFESQHLLLLMAFGVPFACGPGGGGGSGGSSGVGGIAAAAGIAGAAGFGDDAGSGATGGVGGGEAGAGGSAASSTAGSAGAGTGAAAGSAGDASTDSPGPSLVCGDGIRDPVTEECDDGNTADDDACRSDCRVTDFLVVPGQVPDSAAYKPDRVLGRGRHPVAASGAGFAVVFVEAGPPVRVGLRSFDLNGVPESAALDAGAGVNSVPLLASDPVVAPAGNGKYALAWTDFAGDGDELGIAIRIVDPAAPPSGEPAHANTTTAFSQHAPDIIATSSGLIAAWVDDSNATTGPDIRYRTFGADVVATSEEQTLANTSAFESSVVLAPFAGGWAASWRASTASGLETIEVKAGSSTWTVGPHLAGPATDKPALVELDPTTLLVVFSEATATGKTILRGALLSTSAPGNTPATSLEPLAPADGSGQSNPNAMRVGSRIYVAWRAIATTGTSEADELWIREALWTSGSLTLQEPIRLPRWSGHRPGDQRFPALASSPLWPEGALVTAWDDYGQVFGGIEGAPDVVAELIPTPIVRLPAIDGGAGQ